MIRKLFTATIAFLLFQGITQNATKADLIVHLTGNGTANDATPNGNDGAFNGSYGPGQIQQAFNFSSNNFIEVPANPLLENSHLTVALWVNLTASSGTQLIADSSHGSNGTVDDRAGWALQRTGGNQVNFAIGDGVNFPNVSTAALTPETWHHVVATMSPTEISVFLDGSLSQSLTITDAFEPSGRAIRFGRHYGLARQFFGAIDDARIYNEVLSTSSIASLSAVPEPNSFILLSSLMLSANLLRRKRQPKKNS